MPRFFFDFRDGEAFSDDDTGVELDGEVAARREAVRALAEIAREAPPHGTGRRQVALHVRDGEGRPVLVATLTFAVERSAWMATSTPRRRPPSAASRPGRGRPG